MESFNLIAKIYYRLDSSIIQHQRIEYGFADLLGDIGGMAEILTKTVTFFIGGYLSFNASLTIIDSLY